MVKRSKGKFNFDLLIKTERGFCVRTSNPTVVGYADECVITRQVAR